MTESMASEPAEPTTRQEELIEQAGRGVWQSPDGVHLAVEANDGELEWLECDSIGGWLLGGMLDMVPDEWERLVPVGLLADPAQTTELERLKTFERDSLRQIHASWELASRSQAWREDAEDERDALSLLLRGMARKLHRLRRELAEMTGFAGQQSNARRQADRERDDRQARITRAVELIDAGTSTGPHFLSPDETRAVRAALVGDQPPAEEPTPIERVIVAKPKHGVLCSMIGGECRSMHCVRCGEPTGPQGHVSCFPELSGEALRDVEERDDAAGDLP